MTDASNPDLTDDEIKEYARYLILKHAKDVEFLSIFEMYGEYIGDYETDLSDEDARKVDLKISAAKVKVKFLKGGERD